MKKFYTCVASIVVLSGCDLKPANEEVFLNPIESPIVEEKLNEKSKFSSFKQETENLGAAINCANPRIIDEYSPPALWQCISVSAETVKVFINEDKMGGGVRNVKFLWNDWTHDGGYGLHADANVAAHWVIKIAEIYHPKDVDGIASAFKGNANKNFSNEKFDLTYTYHQGPGIGERMIVITSK